MTHALRRIVPLSGCLALVLGTANPAAFAQLLGGTDHFECYVATESTLESPITASLSDQFGDRTDVQIENAVRFCNPVAKTVEDTTTGITEPENHLTFYTISHKSPEPRRIVTVRNQFGMQVLVLTAPRLLAVPTQKEPLPETSGISHFECYEAHAPALRVEVSLQDQFHDTPQDVTVLQPTLFCNPATKTIDDTTTTIEPDEDHLTCYKITPSEQPASFEFIDIHNQLDTSDTLQIGPSQYLCVPSEKLSVVGPPAHAGARPSSGAIDLPITSE
jgi:hypothetical protein